ncbi:MAG: PAS domain S-box protein [Gammaproteobacteria bacterium]|nr:PAS domain S-box protein [Gammaproteobacteria bacterium]
MLKNGNSLDSIPYPAIIIDCSGSVVQANAEAISFSGLHKKALLQRSLHEISHPSDLAEANCPVCSRVKHAFIVKHQTGAIFYQLHHKDKNIWHKTSLTSVRLESGNEGVLQIAVDISEYLNRAQKNLGLGISTYSLLEKIPGIFYRIDQNDVIREIFGAALPKLELPAVTVNRVHGRNIFRELSDKYERIIKHGKYFFESQHETSQGIAFFLHHVVYIPDEKVFLGFALDVSSLKQAQKAMLKLSVDKRHLARKMLQMQEDVRHEVACDLHDEIGQSITAVRMLASAMLEKKNASAETYRHHATNISEIADRMYDVAHDMMYQLRPIVLDTLGLESALNSCIYASGLRQASVNVKIKVHGNLSSMDQLVQLTLFRIVQESLTNAAKHAKSLNILISISRNELTLSDSRVDVLELTVSDDGIGMKDGQESRLGTGLVSMQHRVQALGGIMKISTTSGGGVTIFIRINLLALSESPE